ncbi:hypothetical protein [uncultured Agrobacterium sp.]|nr:hypothetical protein [uncultured Agrobacterium sp.]
MRKTHVDFLLARWPSVYGKPAGLKRGGVVVNDLKATLEPHLT